MEGKIMDSQNVTQDHGDIHKGDVPLKKEAHGKDGKITINISDTLLALKKETIIQCNTGIFFELRLALDEHSLDQFSLQIYSERLGLLGALDYSFENSSRYTEKWVLYDLNQWAKETHGDLLHTGVVKYFPQLPFPDFILKKYNFVESGGETSKNDT